MSELSDSENEVDDLEHAGNVGRSALIPEKSRERSSWLPRLKQPSTSKAAIAQPVLKEESQADIAERTALYQKLLSVRTEIALEIDCMPYMIASNAALMTVARVKPKDLRELLVAGLTEAKLHKFGQRFLNVIYPKPDEKPASIQRILAQRPIGVSTTNVTALTTYAMFESGLTIAEISQKRSITEDTTISHLISCVKTGRPVKLIAFGVTDAARNFIIRQYRSLCPNGFNTAIRLKDLKEKCPHNSYNEIRAVLAYLQVRCHLKSLQVPYEEFEDFCFERVYEKALVEKSAVASDEACFSSIQDEFFALDDEFGEAGGPPGKKPKEDSSFMDSSSNLDSPPRKFV